MDINSHKMSIAEFKPVATGGFGCYSIKLFERNRETRRGECVVFAKLDKGAFYPRIQVHGPTHYFVIKGDLLINETNYEEGDYIRITDDTEFTPGTANGCVVLCIYTGDYTRLTKQQSKKNIISTLVLNCTKSTDDKWHPDSRNSPDRRYLGIYRDETTNERVVVAQLDAGVSFGHIRIPGVTHYYILKGDLVIDGGTYEEETYIRIDAGAKYTPQTKSGCQVLCIYTSGFEKLSGLS